MKNNSCRLICIIAVLCVCVGFEPSFGMETYGAYSVMNISFTDETGNPAFALKANQQITAKAVMLKNSNEQVNAMLILAVHSMDNSLKAMAASEQIYLNKDESREIEVKITIPSGCNSENSYFSTYIWDGFNNPQIVYTPEWYETTFEPKPPIKRDEIHIQVNSEKNQEFKAFGTSMNARPFVGFLQEDRKDEIMRLLYNPQGLGFNVLRLWGNIETDPITKEVVLNSGKSSFKSDYIDSGVIKKAMEQSGGKAILQLTPSVMPDYMLEDAATQIELTSAAAIATKGVDIENGEMKNFSNGDWVIFDKFPKTSNQYTYLKISGAAKRGGTIEISDPDSNKVLGSYELDGSGDAYAEKTFKVSMVSANINRLKATFKGGNSESCNLRSFIYGGTRRIKTSEIDNYTKMVASFIKKLKDEYNIKIDVTGIYNEPLFVFGAQQLAKTIKSMRQNLDSMGLDYVKIIATESAEVDEYTLYEWGQIIADKEALAALDGFCFHSYATNSFNYKEDLISLIGNTGKEMWMNEACDTGAEPQNGIKPAELGASVIARLLNDMNYGTTHWIHFIGADQEDPKDNATRIIQTNYGKETDWKLITQKYDYYKQFLNAFEYGAVFRRCYSEEEGAMERPRGKKPNINVAFAQNKDGSYALGIVNSSVNKLYAQGWGKQNDSRFETQEKVTITIDELKNKPKVLFNAYKSGYGGSNMLIGQIPAINGVLTITLSGSDFITLRSAEKETEK